VYSFFRRGFPESRLFFTPSHFKLLCAGPVKMNKFLRVMKFGGTSVGDASCIARVSQIVQDSARENPVVVVVSAMSHQ
jgi:hypothetical protein